MTMIISDVEERFLRLYCDMCECICFLALFLLIYSESDYYTSSVNRTFKQRVWEHDTISSYLTHIDTMKCKRFKTKETKKSWLQFLWTAHLKCSPQETQWFFSSTMLFNWLLLFVMFCCWCFIAISLSLYYCWTLYIYMLSM